MGFFDLFKKKLPPPKPELTKTEYMTTIQQIADKKMSGGRLYDALLLRCALKAKAQQNHLVQSGATLLMSTGQWKYIRRQ